MRRRLRHHSTRTPCFSATPIVIDGKLDDAAWQQALVLWEVRGAPTLTRTYLATLAGNVGLVSRQLLTVVTPLPAG